MLKLYICPSCKLVRYVSLDNITCYRCNTNMLFSSKTYLDFIKLDLKERKEYIEDFLAIEAKYKLQKDKEGILI